MSAETELLIDLLILTELIDCQKKKDLTLSTEKVGFEKLLISLT